MQLWAFLQEQDQTLIGDFSEHSVNLFRVNLRQKGASDNTIANKLRAIKAFTTQMFIHDVTEQS